MHTRRAIFLLFPLAAALAAAEVSGSWSGTITLASDPAIPIYMTLHQQGQEISGAVAFGSDTRMAPIEKGQLRDDRLSFHAADNLRHDVAFQFTVGDGCLSGEAVTEGQTLKVKACQATPAGVLRVGNGVTAPTLISKVEPKYSEEARQAGLEGAVLLRVEISPDGKATNMRVIRPLGLGLEEKAMEAVALWQFRPGRKDGQPVTVEAQIEVNFRLLTKPPNP
jgi:TonB family protein